jgi:hypothetical protein
MKSATLCLMVCSVALLVGCHDASQTDQASSATSGRDSTRKFGSATDISRKGSRKGEMPSNGLNKADNGLGGPVQREVGNYQQRPGEGQIPDEELAKQIKVALTTGSTGTTGAIAENQLTVIDVKVKDGNVTLTGPVTSESEKTTIGKQVAGFKGVRSVQNSLTVGASNRDQKPLQPLVPRGPGNE